MKRINIVLYAILFLEVFTIEDQAAYTQDVMKCNEPNYKDSIGKKDILSKLKFNCVGCQNKIPYDEIIKHHEYCCPDKKSSDIDKTPTPSKLQRVSSDDIAELKKEGKEMVYITRKPKKYNFYNFI